MGKGGVAYCIDAQARLETSVQGGSCDLVVNGETIPDNHRTTHYDKRSSNRNETGVPRKGEKNEHTSILSGGGRGRRKR